MRSEKATYPDRYVNGRYRDAETALHGLTDSFDGDLVGAVAADGGIVLGLEPVHVDAEGEEFGGLKEVEFAFEEESVGAEINIFFPGDEALDNFIDLGVDEGFPAGNGDHGGTAFIGGGPALFRGEALAKDVVGVLDFAATGAGKVATEEGLEHEDERVVFVPAQLLPENVGGNGPCLADRNWHKRSRKATNPDLYVNGSRRPEKHG